MSSPRSEVSKYNGIFLLLVERRIQLATCHVLHHLLRKGKVPLININPKNQKEMNRQKKEIMRNSNLCLIRAWEELRVNTVGEILKIDEDFLELIKDTNPQIWKSQADK